MLKKYMVHPGFVTSKDGDRHWISARKLMELYGVPPSLCIIFDNRDTESYSGLISRELTYLYPRNDGKYKKINLEE